MSENDVQLPKARLNPKVFHIPINKKKIISFIFILNFIIVGAFFFVKLYADNPQILYNQAGYLPEQDKVILVQTMYPYYTGDFELYSITGDSTVIENGQLEFLGRNWDYYYYQVNISAIQTIGIYALTVKIGTFTLETPAIEISPDIYDVAVERSYEFFYYQRCGVQVYELVPGYVGHEACHLDDGIMYEGEWLDLTGGWHSAGDYAKHNLWGLHNTGVTYSMTNAFETAPEIYLGIDYYNPLGQLKPNNVPDILDEILYGIQYLSKCFLPNGTMLGSLVGTLKFAPPEYDTDNIIGTSDDRHLFYEEDHVFATSDEVMWAVTSFAKFANILNQYGYYSNLIDEINITAQYMFNNYSSNFPMPLPSVISQGSYGYYLPFMLANAELYELTGDIDYAIDSTDIFRKFVNNFVENSRFEKDELGGGDRVFGGMLQWALNNGSVQAINAVKPLIEEHWESYWSDLSTDSLNFFGLYKLIIRDSESGLFRPFYFNEVGIGVNSHYLAGAYAAILASQIMNHENKALLNFAMDQFNWILGRNPYGISMMESVGVVNPPSWHHRYAYIEGNLRGAVPGAVANGMKSKDNRVDKPYFDLSSPFAGSIGDHRTDAMTNEPWLPHNVQMVQALAVLWKYIR
jgi:hypothetical protein